MGSEQKRFGALPPRYRFALNPRTDVRFTRCPLCGAGTRLRKFPLLVHVEDVGLIVLGKTCRLCVACELIIAQADELHAQLSFALNGRWLGDDDFLVLGTVQRHVWRAGLKAPLDLATARAATADFVGHMSISIQPARLARMGIGRHLSAPLDAL